MSGGKSESVIRKVWSVEEKVDARLLKKSGCITKVDNGVALVFNVSSNILHRVGDRIYEYANSAMKSLHG